MPVPVPDTAEGFRPDAQFAVIAQQEEIVRLRTELASIEDRLVWQRAVNLQIQAEANAQISSLLARLTAEENSQRAEGGATGPGPQNGAQVHDDLGLGDSFDPAVTGQDRVTQDEETLTAVVGETVSTDAPESYDPTATVQLDGQGRPIPNEDDPSLVVAINDAKD